MAAASREMRTTRIKRLIIPGSTALAATAALLGLRGQAAPPKPTALVASVPVLSVPVPAAPSPPPLSLPAEPLSPPRFAEELDVSTFQKGNIHTHTSWSDGDQPPKNVYLWYRAHGYAFVAITDHNIFTDPQQFRVFERRRSFTMIPGEEVTMTGAGHQVHVNALCTTHSIGGHHFKTASEALAWAVQKVREQDGIALVNHPNFDWALTARDIPSARGASLLEIFSGHPHVHTDGDETHLSHEAIWDAALSAGEGFAGVAVDDSHHFGARAKETLARPGRAWVEVFADVAAQRPICDALRAGRLYSSSGVKLRRITVKNDTYAITVATPGVEVEFIGQGGAVLERVNPGSDLTATYKLRGGESYVRARITASDGKRAWTQPARLAFAVRAPPGPPALLPDLDGGAPTQPKQKTLTPFMPGL
jgi:hypothetical protein